MGCHARWEGRPFLIVLILILPIEGTAQVLNLAELNTHEIESLDRGKTVVLIPGGILEQHGPYLPAYSDGYRNEHMAEELAEALIAVGKTVVMFPEIPLGTGGANEIGKRYVFPGTYAVRSTTLRAIFMDLASEFGEQGFRWIFIVHGHGAPNHNRALDEASDFFRDAYGGRMVHLLGIVPPSDVTPPDLAVGAPTEEGFSPHAGMIETSWMLFLRPDLVPDSVRTSPDQTAVSWEEILALAEMRDWPGYFGQPRLAAAGFGARHLNALTEWYVDLAVRIVEGFDHSALPRRSELARNNPVNVEIDRAALERERELEAKHQAWLRRRGG